MSYHSADFQGQLVLLGRKNRRYPNLVPELQAIAAALSTDTTTHDVTITLPPAAVKLGPGKTGFTNEALLLVNRGKGGNLANSAMAGIINGALGLIIPPQNTAAPVASGTGTVGQTLSVTNGTWNYAPTSYAYQWMRGAAAISGATSATHVLVAADSGTSVSCTVTATNAAGSTSMASNAIAVA